MPGVTDGRFFARLGIQTYGFLPLRLPDGLQALHDDPRRRRARAGGRDPLRRRGRRARRRAVRRMKLLVLGGTKFLGRAAVEAALAAGHEVTLFNRGTTNPELFPEAERIHGDLAGDLGALAGPRLGRGDRPRPDAAAAADAAPRRGARRRGRPLRLRLDDLRLRRPVAAGRRGVAAARSRPTRSRSEFDLELYGRLKVGSERAVLEVLRRAGDGRPRRADRRPARPDRTLHLLAAPARRGRRRARAGRSGRAAAVRRRARPRRLARARPASSARAACSTRPARRSR